jgi:hypothetical protein
VQRWGGGDKHFSRNLSSTLGESSCRAKLESHSPWPGVGWPEKPVPGSTLQKVGRWWCPGCLEATLRWACWGARRGSDLLVLTAALEYTATGHWGQGQSSRAEGPRPTLRLPPPPPSGSWGTCTISAVAKEEGLARTKSQEPSLDLPQITSWEKLSCPSLGLPVSGVGSNSGRYEFESQPFLFGAE